MTKRSVENDLKDVSDHILGDLDPERRLQMSLEKWAAGDEDENERLMETVPRLEGTFPDPRFIERHRQVVKLSMDARRSLQTGAWKFHWARTQGRYETAMWQAWGGEDGWEDIVEEPSPENDFHEGLAKKMAARFLKSYLLYERFAEEQLDVSLKEFLAISAIPGDDSGFDLIENVAKMADGRKFEEHEDGKERDDDGPGPVEDFEPGWGTSVRFEHVGEERTAEQAADIEYEQLAQVWEETEPNP